MKQTRSVELEAEDWARVDTYIRCYPKDAGWYGRLFTALYAVRPPEPRTVTVGGDVFIYDDEGYRWLYPSGAVVLSDLIRRLLEHTYTLEHPEATP